MSALSDSYEQFIAPINAGSQREGGDSINISFSKNKKSVDDLLKEAALKKANIELAASEALPADAQKQQFDWQKAAEGRAIEDQNIQGAANERASVAQAQQLQIQREENARSAAAAALAAQQANDARLQASKMNPLQVATAKQNLTAGQQNLVAQQQQMDLAKAANARAQAQFENTDPASIIRKMGENAMLAKQNEAKTGGAGAPNVYAQSYANLVGNWDKTYNPNSYYSNLKIDSFGNQIGTTPGGGSVVIKTLPTFQAEQKAAQQKQQWNISHGIY